MHRPSIISTLSGATTEKQQNGALRRIDSIAEDGTEKYNELLQDIMSHCTFFEHTLTIEQLNDFFPLSRLNLVNPDRSQGLNKDEVINHLAKHGRNIVCPVTRVAAIKVFLSQFLVSFRMLLLMSAVLCLIIFLFDTTRTFDLYLSIILITIMIIMCAINSIEEWRARIQVRGFKTVIPSSCVVVRSGQPIRVNAADIVVGDLVLLSAGTRVPADLRLIYTNNLKMEASWINGDMDPVEFTACAASKGVNAMEAHNIAFNGCLCLHGDGLGIVIKAGNDTLLGSLMDMITKVGSQVTGLEDEHVRFVNFISLLALSMATTTFLIGAAATRFSLINNTFVNGFLVVLVASVPQGLPVTLGAALIIIARRLAKKQLFMKRLDVAETLGAATVLMCEKTGIFTSNNITVTDLWHDLKYFDGSVHCARRIKPYEMNIEIKNTDDHLIALLTTMTICNQAQIESIGSGDIEEWRKLPVSNADYYKTVDSLTSNGFGPQPDGDQFTFQRSNRLNIRAAFQHKSITGNPNEVALLRYVEEMTIVQSIREKYEVVYELPFNGQRRYHLVIAREKQHSGMLEDENLIKYYIFVKGAPEVLLIACTRIATEGGEQVLNEDHYKQFKEAYRRFGGEGRSCIGFAISEFEALRDVQITSSDIAECDLCFLGVAAMYDPPRETTIDSLSKLRSAGVKCFMVSGDHPTTALAIATQIGLVKQPDGGTISVKNYEEDWSLVHGEDIPRLTPTEWDQILSKDTVVFARTTPPLKMIILKECQRRNEIMIVTGDSALDAPAIKKAEIGVATDAAGSVFAREASDLIIMDSDLKHIVLGIEEGRLLYDNLKKTIAYVLAHLLPELYAVMLSFLFGYPMGLTTMQVVSIGLITEVPPSLSLTYETPEKDIMQKGPRPRTSRLVSRSILAYSYLIIGNIIAAGCISAYLSVFIYYGIPLDEILFTSTIYWHSTSGNFTTSTGLTFNAAMQVRIHGQACAAWHVTLVMSQVGFFEIVYGVAKTLLYLPEIISVFR
ncbi:hypothetical protein AB6A40_003339 [Gnathostoma spinigerum]|uniref:Cation-transporting P-type ATPase N-terminal domain-containing protein n=1 Tax=Gnathostoma spinigerum TaxID=75299 RepID=A0ABD6EAG3_9BILA